MLKILKGIKSAKLRKDKIKVDGNGSDEFNSRDEFGDNRISNNYVNDKKVPERKNY